MVWATVLVRMVGNSVMGSYGQGVILGLTFRKDG